MTNSGLADGVGSGLLGVEIGRNKVRLSLMDPAGSEVLDMVERPIAKAGGPRDPIEQEVSTRAAIVAALDRLGLAEGADLLAGATIGFSNCGVGSGPALQGWLESLSHEIDEPLVLVGEVGISYAPTRCVEFVQRVFDQSGLRLDRVELAPVAAARVMGHVSSAALSLGSGIAWTARVLDDVVLEAFEATDGPFDDDLRLVGNGSVPPALSLLDGVAVDESLCRNRGVTITALAPAAGVALGLLSTEATNLLDGRPVIRSEAAIPVSTPPPVRPARPSPSAGATSFSREPVSPDFDELDPSGAEGPGAWSSATSKDTYELRRVPEAVDHRSLDRGRAFAEAPLEGEEFDGIEAFAYAEDADRGIKGADMLLGALAMLAIILVVALVAL
ncbi:MAG: hypothetical protein AAFN30_20500 [Actinomycetota bacterium]